MDATTMPLTNSLLSNLQNDFPQFTFREDSKFLWSARHQTISIDPNVEHCNEFTLHELSHALLGHQGYLSDIDLIKLERDAWEYAGNHLAPQYGYSIDEDIVQDNLDTYRDWLHARSQCPDCNAVGLQTKSRHYRCLSCGHTWRVNDAKLCALRRYSLNTK